MNTTKSHMSRAIGTSLLAGLLCCLPTSKQHAQIVVGTSTVATGFQGGAAAVSGLAAGSAVSVADTGSLSASGGAQEAAALETSLSGGISVGTSDAAIIGQENATSSQASVANVSFTGGAGFFGGATTITADFVLAEATSACATFGATLSGQAQVTGLVIDGQAVAVSGAANQVVLLADGGFVLINEQLVGVSAITVNSVHVIDALAGVNVVFGSATAGVTCAI